MEQTTPYVPQDDMDSIEYLNQIGAEQQNLKQQASQTKAVPQQKLKYCPTYQKVDKGPYFMCSQSDNIKSIQKDLNITPDGKFGIDTLNAVYKKFKTTSLTDNMINEFYSKIDEFEDVEPSAEKTNSNELTSFNKQTIKISSTPYFVTRIYANYDTKWQNGEFAIYINATQPGSFGKIKYTFVTNCSLLTKNTVQITKTTKKYTFNDSNVSNQIKNHFCKN